MNCRLRMCLTILLCVSQGVGLSRAQLERELSLCRVQSWQH